ncbi:AAA family ATPase [Tahibacter amnicola]|uniref:AAA family ATPase n=1 Tax=Tahibacter amnicola TaxID=2976241 RepID=A0ABY6BD70_9GAMM|nr:AAA family ATPase [Tahibacter amnicola]UXI67983.1 AAA family ATPase [Tahibacter amnicola]
MELVLFIGLQATGKSSFYYHRFRDTHVRINLDMLRTRHREQALLETCLAVQQPVVIDNTNVSRPERARYIAAAAGAGFRIVGYFFASALADALRRNAARPAHQRVPDKGLGGTRARLERPSRAEGFDALYFVTLREDSGEFDVQEWVDEI